MPPKQHLEEIINLMLGDESSVSKAKVLSRINYALHDSDEKPLEEFADCFEPLAVLSDNEDKRGVFAALLTGFLVVMQNC